MVADGVVVVEVGGVGEVDGVVVRCWLDEGVWIEEEESCDCCCCCCCWDC